MKRDELALLTNLTGDSMVPRSEVVRLNNENLNLRRQIGSVGRKTRRPTRRKIGRGAGESPPNEKTKGATVRAAIRCSGRHPGFDRA